MNFDDLNPDEKNKIAQLIKENQSDERNKGVEYIFKEPDNREEFLLGKKLDVNQMVKDDNAMMGETEEEFRVRMNRKKLFAKLREDPMAIIQMNIQAEKEKKLKRKMIHERFVKKNTKPSRNFDDNDDNSDDDCLGDLEKMLKNLDENNSKDSDYGKSYDKNLNISSKRLTNHKEKRNKNDGIKRNIEESDSDDGLGNLEQLLKRYDDVGSNKSSEKILRHKHRSNSISNEVPGKRHKVDKDREVDMIKKKHLRGGKDNRDRNIDTERKKYKSRTSRDRDVSDEKQRSKAKRRHSKERRNSRDRRFDTERKKYKSRTSRDRDVSNEKHRSKAERSHSKERRNSRDRKVHKHGGERRNSREKYDRRPKESCEYHNKSRSRDNNKSYKALSQEELNRKRDEMMRNASDINAKCCVINNSLVKRAEIEEAEFKSQNMDDEFFMKHQLKSGCNDLESLERNIRSRMINNKVANMNKKKN